jgi:hypothetical protein
MTLIEALEKIGVDYEALLCRVSDNERLAEKLVLKFPKDKTFGLIGPALAANDYGAIEFAVHTLKGIAGNLSFKKLEMLCGETVNDLRGGRLEGLDASCKKIEEEYNRIVDMIGRIDQTA